MSIKISKIRAILPFVYFILLAHANFGYGQENILLQESEMTGYQLERQSENGIIVDEQNKVNNAIEQKWVTKSEAVHIYYLEFDNEIEAIKGIAYAATRGYAWPYIWDSITGLIIGDFSWKCYQGLAIFFVRANIGIQLYGNVDDAQLNSISDKLLAKIEANLSPDIITSENALKNTQIALSKYDSITNSVVNSESMAGFTQSSTWDSKWSVDSTKLVMGLRKEWQNENGPLIGIDICKFDSSTDAEAAAKMRSNHISFFDSNVDLKTLDSLEHVLSKWGQYGLDQKQPSVVGTMDNIAIHIYQHDTSGVDIDNFRAIIEELADQLANF